MHCIISSDSQSSAATRLVSLGLKPVNCSSSSSLELAFSENNIGHYGETLLLKKPR